MANTWGICSVNPKTFNTNYHESFTFPRPLRNLVVTALRINNSILNIAGYIPGVSNISGCVRMAIGTTIVGVTLAIGERNAMQGPIIGRWYDEALTTGISQIARGAFEAFIPAGHITNLVMDTIATPLNLSTQIEGSLACEECMYGNSHVKPHRDAEYPFPFSLLKLV